MESKVISRGNGRSAVAAAAYMSCGRIYNDYDGVQHDYTRKQGLIWQQVFLPEYAPAKWQDRAVLWNAVEENEKTKDSRLAREFVVALPIELKPAEWQALLSEFIQEQFVSDGMCADVCIHYTDGHNPHAHIMLTVRPLDEKGAWQYKTEKEYLCVRGSEERGFTAAEFKEAQEYGWEKQYQYKVGKKKAYLPPSQAEGLERTSKYPKSTKYGRQNPISERWNSEEQLLHWREAWAETANRYLERAGQEERIDHRTHAERGLDEIPTIHEGVKARAMEGRGIIADRSELNRQIKADNAMIRNLKATIRKLTEAVKDSIPAVAEAMEKLRQSLLIVCFRLFRIGKAQDYYQGMLDELSPKLARYTKLRQRMKEKLGRLRSFQSEKKDTSCFNARKQTELNARISELNEELHDMDSEKKTILADMGCPDDKSVAGVRKQLSDWEHILGKLDKREQQFSEELQKVVDEYDELQERVAGLEPDELYAARMKLRPSLEAEAEAKLRELYGQSFKPTDLKEVKEQIAQVLDEKYESVSLKDRFQQKRQESEKQAAKTKERISGKSFGDR